MKLYAKWFKATAASWFSGLRLKRSTTVCREHVGGGRSLVRGGVSLTLRRVADQAITQIGTAALREFRDDNGFVGKAIYYTSTSVERMKPSCADEHLREQQISTYQRDVLGRVLVETTVGAGVNFIRRNEYVGDNKHPSRETVLNPDGSRRGEIRHGPGDERLSLQCNEQHRVLSHTCPRPSRVMAPVRQHVRPVSHRHGAAKRRAAKRNRSCYAARRSERQIPWNTGWSRHAVRSACSGIEFLSESGPRPDSGC